MSYGKLAIKFISVVEKMTYNNLNISKISTLLCMLTLFWICVLRVLVLKWRWTILVQCWMVWSQCMPCAQVPFSLLWQWFNCWNGNLFWLLLLSIIWNICLHSVLH